MRERKPQDECPVLDSIEAFVSRRKGAILWWLRDDPKRFGELRRDIAGVSPKVLTQQLRQLERDGLVHREQFAEMPLRVVYSLTELGRSVLPLLDAPASWWQDHRTSVEEARREHSH